MGNIILILSSWFDCDDRQKLQKQKDYDFLVNQFFKPEDYKDEVIMPDNIFR